MARPREFDEAIALDAAIQCFWAKGFEATSMRDLIDRMSMTSASVYNAFGDKRALYRRALAHYLGSSFGERVIRLEATAAPRQAIELFFEEIIDRSMSDSLHRGCLMVNSALEAVPDAPEAQDIIDDFLSRAEGFFRGRVEAGQHDGSISCLQPAEDLGRLLLGVLLGIRVLARAKPQRPLLESVVRPVLALLDAGISQPRVPTPP
ncbi:MULTISPECIES: TetR/AcrR family transcriptional regulator [unclassified Pseudomonas]|uniref:TetR/AcrR family transcriptional regulator n=1 Tax=unclassified Pseudomonas TaxID=196821 RepID=UPI0015A176A0|nr:MULTISPECIES: TetR/AcrR family transcriptional regulator [unclassified Pseudomonas]NWC93079.1 TetR/AcrR family transcriptional regulator [Pseudomonas sp. IPO3779]NWD19497.1 TetR/AcrR family transcriptional regulator [Pseudomonas sp. IPO3778]